jgi:hypothetical protein
MQKSLATDSDALAFVAETYQDSLRERAKHTPPAVSTILLVIAELVGAAGDTVKAVEALEASN